MRKFRKLSIVVLCIISVFAFSGCRQKSSDGVQRYAWPLGTSSPEDTVTQLYAQKFADEVNRLSKGKMKIEVYPNSTLGGDRELLESCSDGDIPFVVQNTAPQVTFLPETAVFDLPSAFETIKQARQAVDNPLFYDKMEKVYEKGGFKLLGYADQGFRVMSTNKDVKTIDDFKGQKIRTMENSYHMDFWKALKANPTPMTFSEVYIGLQQKTIDAQENPYEVIVSSKLYEQQDYVVETNHLPHYISLIVSDDFYKDLPKDQQKIITKAAETAKEYARLQADARNQDRIDIITKSGTKIVKLDKKTQNDVQEASKPIYKAIEKKVGKNLVDAYLKDLNK